MEDYKKILAISGRPGLYKLIGQMKNGVIVESLDDGKRFPVYVSENISSLQDISIYTEDGELALNDIFQRISKHENKKEASVNLSNSKDLKTYFETIVPNYEKDRVYNSDIKKVIKWYNVLLKKKLLILEKEEEKSKKEDNKKETATSKAKKATSPKKKPATTAKKKSTADSKTKEPTKKAKVAKTSSSK